MTEKYIRHVRGYQYIETDEGIEGKELYVRDDDHAGAIAVASLPVVGTTAMVMPNGSNNASCICRRKETAYPDGDTTTPVITYAYSTKKGTEPGGGVATEDSRRFSAGLEYVQVNDPLKPTWYFLDSTPCTIALSMVVITGQFSIPKRVAEGDKAAFLTAARALYGKLNAAVFEGFAIGEVMFAGLSGGTVKDKDGNRVWVYECNFVFKCIPSLTDTGNLGTWNYVWRSTAWVLVIDATGGTGYTQYGKASFTGLGLSS